MVRSWVSYTAYPTTCDYAYAKETSLINSLIFALNSGNIDYLKVILQNFMDEAASYHDFHRFSEERFYHVFLLGMTVALREHFTVHSNKKAGLGRFDLALASKSAHQSMLIELKQSSSAEQLAPTQITDKRYDAVFSAQKPTKILNLGLEFYSKQVAFAHCWHPKANAQEAEKS